MTNPTSLRWTVPTPTSPSSSPGTCTYQLVHDLCGALPPPVTDSPEDRARRDNAAIAAVACLLPANADEANLAAQCAAANAHALDCLRQARECKGDVPLALKCTAQAARMMREARGARSLLLRVQAVRQKREADEASLDKAAMLEYCTVGLMADALGRTPPAPMAEPPPPPPEPVAVEAAAPQPDLVAEAEQYAVIYPRRAALIRSLGGLPDNCGFGPPPPELVHAIATGASATLRALDSRAEAAAAD